MAIWILLITFLVGVLVVSPFLLSDYIKERAARKKNQTFNTILLFAGLLGYRMVRVHDPEKGGEIFNTPPVAPHHLSARKELLIDMKKFVNILGAKVVLGASGDEVCPKWWRRNRRTIYFLNADDITYLQNRTGWSRR